MKIHAIIIVLVMSVVLVSTASFNADNGFDEWMKSIAAGLSSGLSANKSEAFHALAASTAYLMFIDSSKKTAAKIGAGTFVLSKLYNSWIEWRRNRVNAEINTILLENTDLQAQIDELFKKYHSYAPIIWDFERDILYKRITELHRQRLQQEDEKFISERK